MIEQYQNATLTKKTVTNGKQSHIDFFAEDVPTVSQLIEEMKNQDLKRYIAKELGIDPQKYVQVYENALAVGELAFRMAYPENSRLCRREDAAHSLKMTIEEMNTLPATDRNVADAIQHHSRISLSRLQRMNIYEVSLQQAKNAIALSLGREIVGEPDTEHYLHANSDAVDRSAKRALQTLLKQKQADALKPVTANEWMNESLYILARALEEHEIKITAQDKRHIVKAFNERIQEACLLSYNQLAQKNKSESEKQVMRWSIYRGTVNSLFEQALKKPAPFTREGTGGPLFEKAVREIEVYNELARPNEFVKALYDYAFQRTIQAYNLRHAKQPEHMIQASEGPTLWKELQANLTEEMSNVNCRELAIRKVRITDQMLSMSNKELHRSEMAKKVREITAEKFIKTVNKTLNECPLIPDEEKEQLFISQKDYDEYRNDLRGIIQFQKNNEFYGLMPLSPFNENYSQFYSMKRRGTDFLYIPLLDLETSHDLKDLACLRYIHTAQPFANNNKLAGWTESEYETVLTNDDLSGYSAFSGFFSEDVLKKYRRHVESAPSKYWQTESLDSKSMSCICQALHLPNGKMPEWTMENWPDLTYGHQQELKDLNVKSGKKALAILEHLEENGCGYELVKDVSPGQLAVKLTDGSGLKIRIKDLPENSKWIGRSDINGTAFYFYYNDNGKSVKHPNPSADDVLNLIDFAMNRPVKKNILDTPRKKTSEEYILGERFDKGANTATSKLIGGNMTVLYGNLKDVDAGQKSRVFIKAEKKRNSRITASSYRSEQMVIEQQRAANLASPQDKKSALTEAEMTEVLEKYNNWTQKKTETFDEYEKTPDNLAKNRFVRKLKGSAEARLFEMVKTARQNLETMIDPNDIYLLIKDHKDDKDYEPQFYGSEAVTELKYAYYDLITKNEEDNVWLKPSVSQFEYEEMIRQAKNGQLTDEELKLLDDMVLRGSAKEVSKQHASLYVQQNTGDMYKDESGKWIYQFNPAGVALYQTNDGFSVTRSQLEIVSCFKAIGLTGDDLPYRDYDNEIIREKLLRFDPTTGHPMNEETNPFLKDMYQTICQSLKSSAVQFDENDILIDDRGVVSYKFRTGKNMTNINDSIEFFGEIGQLWAPDEDGKVKTHYAYSQNYYCLPGYRAYLQKQKAGENKSFRERMLLKGYQQSMKEAIQQQIRCDIMETARADHEHAICGSAVSLNRVFSKLYDTRWPINYKEMFEKSGMPEDIVQAIIATETRGVRFDADFVKNSDIMNQLEDNNKLKNYENGSLMYPDLANDRFGSAWIRSGRTQLSSLGEHLDGWADHHATGTGQNQGRRIYLTEDATVTPDGRILPGKPGGKCPLMRLMTEQFYSEFDAADRVNMDFNNLKSAQTVTDPVYSAMMTFGGWTQDDGMVISKDIADRYQVHYESGDEIMWRPLEKGDKIDAHGNKGVISLVIDRSMSEEEAIEQGIYEQWKVFHDNPQLDLVMSPFSEVSRNNGGTYREMSASKADLINSSGERIPGGMGKLRLIITDKTANEKTKVSEKNGRKFSSQLSWIVQGQDCPAVMREVFDSNTTSFMDAREIMLTLGITMSENGDLSNGITDDILEMRQHFKLPDPSTFKYDEKVNKKSISYTLDKKKLLADIQNKLAVQGGVMELPFPIRLKNGDYTPQTENGVYVLPVMSSHLRSGVKLQNGLPVMHDYSRKYAEILDKAVDYLDCEERERRNISTAKDAARKQTALKAAQNLYDEIAQELEATKITSKHNIFREGIMTKKMPRSSTAIWTPDPRLKMNEMTVSREIADAMGVKDGHSVFMWRDPTLHVRCAKYLKINIRDDLHGIAVNPAMASSMDGDFDGDTIGMIALKTKEARQELNEKFGMQNSLINWGVRETDEYGLSNFKFAFQTGIDIQAARWLVEKSWENIPKNEQERYDRIAFHSKGEFKNGRQLYETVQREWEVLDAKKNSYAARVSAGTLSGEQLQKESDALMEDCNRAILHAQMISTGQCVISMNSPEEHVRSLEKYCVESGAKGSYKKVKTACTYAGIDYECIADGEQEAKMIPGTVTQAEHRLGDTAQMDRNQQTASYIKQAGTGIAGKQSQYAVRMIKSVMDNWKQEINIMPFSPIQAALEVTYFNTQRILQCKHDADEAVEFLQNVQKLMPLIWSGKVLQKTKDNVWNVLSDAGSATQEQWVEQAFEIYTEMGIAINPQMLETCAHYLSIAAKSQGMPDLKNINDLEDIADPMDQMAYDSSFVRLKKLASKGANIFEGYCARQFMCKSIRNHIENEKAQELQQENAVEQKPAKEAEEKVSEKTATQNELNAEPKAEQKKDAPRILSSSDVLEGYTPHSPNPSAAFDVKKLSEQIPKPRTDLPFSNLKNMLDDAGFEFEMD